MAWTSDDLITRARLYAYEPTESDGGLTDAEVLSLIQGELESHVLPRVVLMREEFGIVDYEYTITAGRETYRVPKRALGARLRDVVYIDSSEERFPLLDINLEQLKTSWREPRTDTRPYGYYVQNNAVHLVPTPTTAAGTLLLRYPLASPTLVAPSNTTYVHSITAINDVDTPGQVRLYAASMSLTAGFNDVIKGTNPYDTVFISTTVPRSSLSGASGYVGYYTTELNVDDLAVGDYLCLSGYSPVAPLPDAMQPWLALRGACRILELRSNDRALSVAQRRASEMESMLVDLEQPRVESASKLLIPRNSPHRRWR